MIVLDNTDVLAGFTTTASKVDYTIHGIVDKKVKQIADGQLGDTTWGDLYTAIYSGTVIHSITLVNTNSTAESIRLALEPAGAGTYRRLANISLAAGYMALFDGGSVQIISTDGEVLERIDAVSVEVAELTGATYDDVQDFINFYGARGVISGGTITDNGDGSCTVAAGTAWAKETDSVTATGVFFNFAQNSSVALSDGQTNFIQLDYNAGTPQIVVVSDVVTDSLELDHVPLGVVYRSGTSLCIVDPDYSATDAYMRSQLMAFSVHGIERASGLVATSTGTRNLSITAGVMWAGYYRIATLPFDTSRSGTADADETNKLHDADSDFASTDVGKFAWNETDSVKGLITAFVDSGELTLATDAFPDGNEDYYIDWWSTVYTTDSGSTWVETEGEVQIDNANYNDITSGLVPLTANRYAVHWPYMSMDGKKICVLYGQGDYTAAQAELAEVPSVLPPKLVSFGKLIAKIIVQQGSDTLTISYPWTTTFQTSLATDHGSLAGLGDDDHTQYIRHALSTAASDFLVGSGSNTYIKKTLAETGAILEADINHDNLVGFVANEHLPGIDEDNMASDSAVHVPTQQSVKAYVDTHAADTSTHGVADLSILDDIDLGFQLLGHGKTGAGSRGNLSSLVPFGYTETNAGSGNSDTIPNGIYSYTGTTANSSSQLRFTCNFLRGGGGSSITRINWAKILKLRIAIGRLNSDTEFVGRWQIKEATASGILAEKGIGLQLENYTLTGEAYGTSRGTASLATLTNVYVYWIDIVNDPASGCYFYVNNSLAGSITNSGEYPTGAPATTATFQQYVANGATGGVSGYLYSSIPWVWIEL